MITISNLGFSVQGRSLFQNVNISFSDGNRYGVTGANGAGKSTFLRILIKSETPSEGDVFIPDNFTIGTLEQDFSKWLNDPVWLAVLSGKQKLYHALRDKERLKQNPHASGEEMAKIEEVLAYHDGYSARSLASRLLSGLGIPDSLHEKPLANLSGGWRLRVMLARALFIKPDLLALDEPTNHLDIIAIRWLENYLVSEFSGTLMLISHDRDFLNRVCTHIADIDYNTITLYTGNYDRFVTASTLYREQKEKEIANLQKKISETQEFINRFKAKASKARQAQSRVKQLERIEVPEIVNSSRKWPAFDFPVNKRSGKEALAVKGLSKSYKSPVFQNINFELFRGQKVGIIGSNGAGKSTLLKILSEKIAPDSGRFQFGHEVSVGYFDQDHRESAHNQEGSVLQWLISHNPKVNPGTLRSILGAALFTKDDVEKKLNVLSGGESARLYLANIMAQSPNFLLLDEPTNHLDLESVASLENALEKFEGTLLFVSHDRRFVTRLAERIFVLENGNFLDYTGTYDEWLTEKGEDYFSLQSNLNNQKQASVKKHKKQKGKEAYLENKERKKKLSQLSRRCEMLEKEINELEAEIKNIENQFSEPQQVQKMTPEILQSLQKNKSSLEKKLSIAFTNWEKAQTDLQKEKEENSI